MLVRRLLAFGALAFAAVGVLTTSTAATAAGSKCVALVVDSTHVGGSVSSACVTVATSASGSDVLVAGHHKVTFDPRYGNDFVCAIDGVPAGGCHATDDTHYWAYYHRAPGRTAWHISAPSQHRHTRNGEPNAAHLRRFETTSSADKQPASGPRDTGAPFIPPVRLTRHHLGHATLRRRPASRPSRRLPPPLRAQPRPQPAGPRTGCTARRSSSSAR